ncbi:MAG: hypothetical protein GKS00_11395 [Alphaproteobacteria bacterium]|nr:hypothetical protein [Alphaproteobacteria bacterium]NKC02277.1 hypothetical protein [Pseudomonadales bacterium]
MPLANDNFDSVFILCDDTDWHIGSELDHSLLMSAIRTFARRHEIVWKRGEKPTLAKIQKSTAVVIVVSETLVQNYNDHQIYIDAIIRKFSRDDDKRKRIVLLSLDEDSNLEIPGLEGCKTIPFDTNGDAHLEELYFYLKECGIRPVDKDTDKTSGYVPWEPVEQIMPSCSGLLFNPGECDLVIKARSLEITLYHAIKISDSISYFEYHVDPRQIAVIYESGVVLDLGLLVSPRLEVTWNMAREVHVIRTSNGAAVEGFARRLNQIGNPSWKTAMQMKLFAAATNSAH